MNTSSSKLIFCLCLASCVILSGCIPILIGAGVATGYLATKDTASGNVEVAFTELWDNSLKVVAGVGEVTDQNKQAGLIKATSARGSIVVRIRELTESSYSLKVTCRKAVALANLTLAQEIFTKIIRTLSK